MNAKKPLPHNASNLVQQVQLALAQSERSGKPRSFVVLDGLFVKVNVNSYTTLAIWRSRKSDLVLTDWCRFNDCFPYPMSLPAPVQREVLDERTNTKRRVWSAAWPTPPRLIDADVSKEVIAR